jgi:preprotein translocase subunit SecD
MKPPLLRINIILAFLVLLLPGCATTEEKEAASLRLHLETNPDGTPYNFPVPIYRANPILVNIERSAVLDEAFMTKAEMVDVDEYGGHAIKVTFDEEGTKRLDYLTTSYKGRRIAINASWTESRWIAAPLITKRIADGVLVFTPDASRKETERILLGLKNVIKELKKPFVF